MARGTTANVLAGIPDSVGGLWVYPTGLLTADALPTADTDLATAGLVSVGFIGEDGVTETAERDTEKKKAWGGDTIRVLQNEYNQTFSFVLAEAANAEVLKLVYGPDNVTVAADGSITVIQNSKTLPHRTWVMEILDDDGKKVRKVIPDGQISEISDITWVHSDIVQYEVTMETFIDAAGNNVYTHITPVAAAGGTGGGDDGDDSGETPAP
jgi:hypothetical protein